MFQFGENIEGIGYKVVDERVMRGSAGILLLLGMIAFVNGFVIKNYDVLPYITGFFVINFFIGVFINLNYAPTIYLAKDFVEDQEPLHIGAIQKHFAWSLGLGLSVVVFILSLFLVGDPSYFNITCFLCLICFVLLYLETAFGVCIGCKLYYYTVQAGFLKEPEEKPNCMGDSCKID
ncbi:MAG: DUF4395 domain-containing protein [Campylobacterales bacterium]|nr:DUF4395 domain-containing protein [Campylobacterales bacterium]